MKKTKKWWLRATAALTLVLGIGYFAVNASENKTEVLPKNKTELLDPIYKWYELVPTSNSSPSSQTLADDQPMSTPPPSGTGTICAQNNNTGNYCAVLVKFAPGTTDFTLSDLVTLDVAISGNPDAEGIANQTGTPDPNADGYSRHPSV